MKKIAAYIAAWQLQKLVAERKAAMQQQVNAPEPVADYGDNGTEAPFYLIVDNFR